LIDAGLSSITISVDAIGAKFDKIRGFQGAFEKVEKACTLLSDFGKSNSTFVGITFVLMKPTFDCIKDVVGFAKNHSLPLAINLLDYTPYFFRNRENKKDFWPKEEDSNKLYHILLYLMQEKAHSHRSIMNDYASLNYAHDYFKEPVQAHIPCSISQFRILIAPRGEVYGGCWSSGSFGNLREDSLSSIIDSNKYKKAHKKMFFKECSGCSCGYLHNLRYYLPYIMSEVRYRFLPFTIKNRVYS